MPRGRAYDYFNDVVKTAIPTRQESGEWVYADEFGRTRDELLMVYVERQNELDSIASVYQTADKIITGEDISVSVTADTEMETTAMNNGKDIIYNASLIEDLDSETITSLHGTNYHEVAHILFSPRAGSTLGKFAKEQKVIRSFNMLEEARIENLMIAKYPSTRLFLETAITSYLLKDDPNEWGEAFPILTGRKYVDVDIRQAVADKFINKYGVDVAQRVQDIVHAYSSLVFPTDFRKAKDLLTMFADIVGRDTEQTDMKSGEHGERMVGAKGRPASAKEQARLQKRAEQSQEPTELLQKGQGVGGNSTEENTDTKQYNQDDERIAKKLTERMNEIKNDSAVKREVSETRKAISGNEDIKSIIKKAELLEMTPSQVAVSYARRFGTELERLVRNNDPMWDSRTPSGKLNISRTMNPDVNSIGEMFDQWNIGNDNSDIEAVMLLDNSGSMGGYMTEVCQNAWIIKRGVETIEGSVSVFAFDHESKKIYDKTERALPRKFRYINSRGNTAPFRTLIEAERILTASDKSIKILFMLTDGDWSDNEECDKVIKRLNQLGVLTCLVFLSDYTGWQDIINASKDPSHENHVYYSRKISEWRHGVKIFRAVTKPRDVLDVANDLVTSTLERKG
jgi:hypothetical protein